MTGGRHPMGSRAVRAVAAAGGLLLAGCATVPPGAGSNPTDPWERFNRQTYEFNDTLDKYLLKPLAKAYEWLLPHGIRLCINNGFTNMLEIRTAVNDILQAKAEGAATDTGRLIINSTLGVAGCFDIATRMGLERRQQDFGLTLANWGFDPGPYVVLPVLGPSDVRDGIGLVPDSFLNPIKYIDPASDRNIVLGVNVIDTRASLLEATKLLDQMALDRYQYTRDAYLQRRRNLQYEGNPPPPKLEEDDSGESGPGAGGTEAKPASPPPEPAPGGTEARPAQPPPEDRR